MNALLDFLGAVLALLRPAHPPASGGNLRPDIEQMCWALDLDRPPAVRVLDEALHEQGMPVFGEVDLDGLYGPDITIYAGCCRDRAELLATLLHELAHARCDHGRHDPEWKRVYALAAKRLWPDFPCTPYSASRLPYKELDLFVARAARRALASAGPAFSALTSAARPGSLGGR